MPITPSGSRRAKCGTVQKNQPPLHSNSLPFLAKNNHQTHQIMASALSQFARSTRMSNALCQRLSFISSSSAKSFVSKPKFQVPRYAGQSLPTPSHSISDVSRNQIDIAIVLRPSFESQTPLVLRNLLGTCNAIYFWCSLEYWRVAVGEYTPVEVEIGKGYNSGNRVTMMFGEYLNYLELNMEIENREYQQYQRLEEQGSDVQHQRTDQEVAYLAQNELFRQVMNDIPIPSFCEDGKYCIGDGKLYHTMLWMGPRHTVSPLHFDPLDNLLMQVVGWKRVLLFPPHNQLCGLEGGEKEEMGVTPSWHYAGADGNQYNTSAVDIEKPDHTRFPDFKALGPIPYECVLGPGDGLYIPKRWWHHVRSLEMSVSANVWWR